MQKDTLISGIYCIENLSTNKKYIGQSVNISERWKKHISELNNGLHHNDYLQKAWNKYGIENFKFYVLEYCSIDKLNEKEIYYIDYYDTLNRDKGYNLKSGGQDHNSYSTESRHKMSDSVKKSYLNSNLKSIRSSDAINQWKNPKIKEKITGKNNGMYGRHHTEEAKKKIAESKIGKPSSRRNTTPVFCIELNKEFKDAAEAAKELSLDSSAILKVCRKQRKTCGGYTWEFLNIGK